MSKFRKTLDRSKLVEQANKALKVDETLYVRNNADFRQGIISCVQGILIECNSYRGFGYLFESDLDNPDNKPGINGKMLDNLEHENKFQDTDSTRIFFY